MSVQTNRTTRTTYRTVNVASPEPVASTVTSSYRTVNVASPEPVASTVTSSYRTVNVASPEPVASTVTSSYRTVNLASTQPVISSGSVSPVQPLALNGSYEGVRYLVPMQQQQQQLQQLSYFPVQQQQQLSYIPVRQQQQQYVFMQQQQPMMQQVVSPVYMQSLPRLSVSSQDSTDLVFQQQSAYESASGKSSVFSQSSKSPEPSAEEEEEEEEEEDEDEETVELEEVEIVHVIQQKPPPPIEKISRTEVRRTELREIPQPTKMDTRYFGELLAEVYRKNCDIHSCISEHVSKIRGQKHQLDTSNDYKVEKEAVEASLPKGATELTKQQIRYLLQTRLTADKSMRLLLSTFSSLREELLHMSEDLRRLEAEKESLERDLSFKADQAQQYDCLLVAVRENNRQLQVSLKESSTAQHSLESQLMGAQSNGSSRDFKLKEVEGRMRALEKENEMLRQKLAGQGSSTTLHLKTEELSRQYKDQLSAMKQEKDLEMQRLRSQITRMQTETVTIEKSSSDQSLHLKISEMITMLEQRQTIINQQQEEIKRLMQAANSSSSNQVTKTIITNSYKNRYPLLGLLGDDYQSTSPVQDGKTIVIERSERKMVRN
ncbi:protein POF1B [Cyclopterus lumpus]|uniref:POF1B actin binding protein n=1 Tax=Cyclopterus lumpus TaxID=8103 RepID=A0A8C3ANW3_CYCLU|nr:protein POF1B [Cyclopterus lumpus]